MAKGWGLGPVVGLLAAATLLSLVLPTVVGLPRLGAVGDVKAPAVSFSAWAIAMASIRAGTEPAPEIYATASRGAHVANLLRIAGVVLGGAGILALVSPGSHAAVVVACASLAGEAWLGAAVVGLRLAWFLPTLHVLAAASLGAVHRYSLAWWAWPLMPRPGGMALVGALAVLFAGLTGWALASRSSRLT